MVKTQKSCLRIHLMFCRLWALLLYILNSCFFYTFYSAKTGYDRLTETLICQKLNFYSSILKLSSCSSTVWFDAVLVCGVWLYPSVTVTLDEAWGMGHPLHSSALLKELLVSQRQLDSITYTERARIAQKWNTHTLSLQRFTSFSENRLSKRSSNDLLGNRTLSRFGTKHEWKWLLSLEVLKVWQK